MSADAKALGGTSTSDAEERAAPASVPRLPVRASIYIDPDGSVHFGALFEGLVPVADALRGKPRLPAATPSGDSAAAEGPATSARPQPATASGSPVSDALEAAAPVVAAPAGASAPPARASAAGPSEADPAGAAA